MISFREAAFEQYDQWAEEDKKIHRKITALIREIRRDPFHGTGKPEPLKGDWEGFWSRRITQEHRLIYKVSTEHIIIVSCRDHY